MNQIVHLVLSDNTFGGFEHDVELTDAIVSLQQLVDSIISKLRETLIFHKFETARILLQEKNFHIHGLTMDEIRNRADNDAVYVCNN